MARHSSGRDKGPSRRPTRRRHYYLNNPSESESESETEEDITIQQVRDNSPSYTPSYTPSYNTPSYNTTRNNSPQYTQHSFSREIPISPTPSFTQTEARSPDYTPTDYDSPRSLPRYSPVPYDHDDDEDYYEEERDSFIVRPTRDRSMVRSNSRSVSDVAEVVGDNGDVERVLTLSDPDVLDCTICLDPLTVPVFQCENGHIACSSCSTRVRNKCPSCTLPIGSIRCRAVEKIIESVKISCRNFIYGCFDKTSYFNKDEHEKTCTYAPCSCPYLNCTFIGSLNQIDEHFTSEHPNIAKHFHFDNSFTIQINPNEKYVILQQSGGLLFILNNMEFQSVGNLISVSCIKPSTFRIEFSYDLVARKGDFVVKLESVAVNVAKRVDNSIQKRFLMVPRDFINACGKIKLEVHIFSQSTS